MPGARPFPADDTPADDRPDWRPRRQSATSAATQLTPATCLTQLQMPRLRDV
jgi:hypothetical protein